ncbi:unnamed protein product [Phyllotreta striolata]|uniref:C2H2-type domain-containing protein n=1 Tax=Phyllotreta striolata TaxID=444603 RepID=A0A9N9TRZ3_PHYSR|nr:unnamed protein product [Phyllotreta striolata]
MSENIQQPTIQYILNDTEFIFDSPDLKTDELNDIIYTDGNQAFILNGHLLQGEPTTLVLQEGNDIGQYLINDDKGELLIANIENSTVTSGQDTQQIIQYLDEDGNITDPSEIIFVNENDLITSRENCMQYQLAEITDNTQEEIINVVDVKQENANDMQLNATDWYQYSTVNDNSISSDKSTNDGPETNTLLNTSAIKGKNLLTGQVVTLDSYMNKIQNKFKLFSKNSLSWKKPKHNLNAFLNKKFNLGLTIGGRQLVGKIVRVGNKEVDDSNASEDEFMDNTDNSNDGTTNLPNTSEDISEPKTKLFSKKSDQFNRVFKILTDLMKMQDINKQLCAKNIRVKVIDKHCISDKKINTHVSFISGYMESNGKNEKEQEWTFVPDIVRPEFTQQHVEKKSQKKYTDNISITILTTYQKNESFVQVIFDDLSSNLQCDYCTNTFNDDYMLKSHLNNVHRRCEYCKILFNDLVRLREHKKVHLQSSDMKICPVGNCKSSFKTEVLLKKHLDRHKLEDTTYSELSESNLNQCQNNLNVHPKTSVRSDLNIKKIIRNCYACTICKRRFSRQFNLQRHMEVHKGAEQLYKCSICDCSYHYVSSLTRHIVQNHVQINRNDD